MLIRFIKRISLHPLAISIWILLGALATLSGAKSFFHDIYNGISGLSFSKKEEPLSPLRMVELGKLKQQIEALKTIHAQRSFEAGSLELSSNLYLNIAKEAENSIANQPTSNLHKEKAGMAYLNLTRIEFAKNNSLSAKLFFKKALKFIPKNESALFIKGIFLMEDLGNGIDVRQQAREVWLEFLNSSNQKLQHTLSSQKIFAFLSLAFVEATLNNDKDAIGILNKNIEKALRYIHEPNNDYFYHIAAITKNTPENIRQQFLGEIYAITGVTYLQLRRYNSASDHLNKALGIFESLKLRKKTILTLVGLSSAQYGLTNDTAQQCAFMIKAQKIYDEYKNEISDVNLGNGAKECIPLVLETIKDEILLADEQLKKTVKVGSRTETECLDCANTNARTALHLSQIADDTYYMAQSHVRLAWVSERKALFSEVAKHLAISEELVDKVPSNLWDNDRSRFNIYNLTAHSWLRIGRYKKAQGAAEKALLDNKSNDKSAMAILYIIISEANIRSGSFPSAHKALEMAFAHSKNSDNYETKLKVNTYASQYFLKQLEFTDAAKYAEKAIVLSETTKNNRLLAKNLITLAEARLESKGRKHIICSNLSKSIILIKKYRIKDLKQTVLQVQKKAGC